MLRKRLPTCRGRGMLATGAAAHSGRGLGRRKPVRRPGVANAKRKEKRNKVQRSASGHYQRKGGGGGGGG